jgi:2-oxoglutarate dehydrogenase E2 component (dihydrolipoamide succinyltransferase)
MRMRISERPKEVQNNAASLATFNEIAMPSLIEMRTKFKDQILKDRNIKLMFMSAFARASVRPTLNETPAANASTKGDSIVLSRSY